MLGGDENKTYDPALADARNFYKVELWSRGRFMIRSRTRVVKRHPEGDW